MYMIPLQEHVGGDRILCEGKQLTEGLGGCEPQQPATLQQERFGYIY